MDYKEVKGHLSGGYLSIEGAMKSTPTAISTRSRKQPFNLQMIVMDKKVNPDDAYGIVEEAIDRALLMTKIDTINTDLEMVPKRTGQLRDTIMRSINSWNVNINFGTLLEWGINLDLDYAYNIQGNPKHKGTYYEHSGKLATAYYYGFHGKVWLEDPRASIDWDNELRTFIIVDLKKNFQIELSGRG